MPGCAAAMGCGAMAICGACGTRQSSSWPVPRSSSTSASRGWGGRGEQWAAAAEGGGKRRQRPAQWWLQLWRDPHCAFQQHGSTANSRASLTLAHKGHLTEVLGKVHLGPGVVPAARGGGAQGMGLKCAGLGRAGQAAGGRARGIRQAATANLRM